jgi:hypothetical protein
MEIKEIRAVIKLMKREKVQSLKVENLELHLSPYAFSTRTRVSKKVKNSDHVPTDNYSDEDILMWSANAGGLNG